MTQDITQLPWIMDGRNSFVPEGRNDYIAWVYNDDGKVICETQGRTPEEAKANAAFIVRACNNHARITTDLATCLTAKNTSSFQR